MLSSCVGGLGLHAQHGPLNAGRLGSTQVVLPRQVAPCLPGKRGSSSRGSARISAVPNKDKRGTLSSSSSTPSSPPQPSPVAAQAAAPATASVSSPDITVRVDNDSDKACTIVCVRFPRRPGLLPALSNAFKDLSLLVSRADVSDKDKPGQENAEDRFFVKTPTGGKVTDIAKQEQLIKALLVLAEGGGQLPLMARPKFGTSAGKSASISPIMDTYKKNDVLSIQENIVSHIEYTMARSRYRFDDFECYQATALSLRDRLVEQWNDTQTHFKDQDPKRVYYLSMEFLMGRSLLNTLYNIDVHENYEEALREMGYKLETLVEQERDAALGNGGLGRLAACFLDSMAALNLPAWGYGLRYQYGMFKQTLVNGFQHEQPDYWLTFGNPWEIERPVVSYPINFFGHVSLQEEAGRQIFTWSPGEQVTAVAHDNPIPGFATRNCINLRLWSAKPAREFDLEAFNTGDYVAAILSKQRAETLSSVLYPNDRTYEGKELRLKQQHFFVSATIQDVVRRFADLHRDNWDLFPEKVVFQLNDTHPTIAVPELMRVLVDIYKLGWTRSWNIVSKVFAFTNHTVLPEALEKWSVGLMERLLPRHMQIIYDINWRYLQQLRAKFGDDWDRISRMSIIEEAYGEKYVRMAYLGVVCAHTVNGVADLHTNIIKNTIFKDFYALWPEKFQNKTNGVTQRRWLAFCNPPLRKLISRTLGNEEWITDLYKVQELRKYADNAAFQAEWQQAKKEAKQRAVGMIERLCGVKVSPDAMFDVQVKRIHEYKRQLLNVLGIVHRYNTLKSMPPEKRKTVVPRVCIIGGKAAPGYDIAKRIIKLVCAVGDKINNDPEIGDLLKLVFVPDYNVSSAEVLIPASDVSQHISTAGTEASGTSNMKFSMNGSLILGTMDGATIEIVDEIGEENAFIFGARAPEVGKLRAERHAYQPDERFNKVVQAVRSGQFGWADYLEPVMHTITNGGDYYLVANDFPAYLEAQDKVDQVYKDQKQWCKMSIMSTAGSGRFSTDRTISNYAKDIWKVEPCVVPMPEGA
uniref:Alpha-1,4 glucan phosphorylase n=1 Tax=Dunaliella salina TaxID=3046 RepID=T2B457_DUNSA|nr:starch phosphorylase [Dunaliella salina]